MRQITHSCTDLPPTDTLLLLQAALTDTDVMAAHIPIVFLHGIGGLPAYLELLLYMMALGNPLLVVEMRSVAMRLG